MQVQYVVCTHHLLYGIGENTLLQVVHPDLPVHLQRYSMAVPRHGKGGEKMERGGKGRVDDRGWQIDANEIITTLTAFRAKGSNTKRYIESANSSSSSSRSTHVEKNRSIVSNTSSHNSSSRSTI